MWERGARHNPLSYRYRFYFDHRPILPQDPSMSWFPLRGKLYDQYALIYLSIICGGAKRKLFLNNMPTHDRESLKNFLHYYDRFFKNLGILSLIPTFFTSGLLFKYWTPGKKILYPLGFLVVWSFNDAAIKGYLKSYANNYVGYFYHKYSHLSVEDLNSIDDPRRKFFRLDTKSYYRQSHEDILHKQHHGGHHDHEAPYYGNSPVKLFLFYI